MLDRRPTFLTVPLDWEGQYLRVSRDTYWLYKSTGPDGSQHFVRGRPTGPFIDVTGIGPDGIANGLVCHCPVPVTPWVRGALLVGAALFLSAFVAFVFSAVLAIALGAASLLCLAYAMYQSFAEKDEERGQTITAGWIGALAAAELLERHHRHAEQESAWRRQVLQGLDRGEHHGPLDYGDR